MSAEGLALYVHWPFCVSKCPYCDFNSHVRPQSDPVRRGQLLRFEQQARLAGDPWREICDHSELRPRSEVSLVQRFAAEFLRHLRLNADYGSEGPLPVAQPARERDLQLLHAASAASASAAATPAASAASSDADVPGWLGDPGYGDVPGSAASASAAATGARARSLRGSNCEEDRPGQSSGPVFFCLRGLRR